MFKNSGTIGYGFGQFNREHFFGCVFESRIVQPTKWENRAQLWWKSSNCEHIVNGICQQNSDFKFLARKYGKFNEERNKRSK